MRRQLITDNDERIEIYDDGERYALIYKRLNRKETIILNPREANSVAKFILSQPTTFKLQEGGNYANRNRRTS